MWHVSLSIVAVFLADEVVHPFLGLALSSSIAIGGVPKITNSNSSPGPASKECITPAGMIATLPGRSG